MRIAITVEDRYGNESVKLVADHILGNIHGTLVERLNSPDGSSNQLHVDIDVEALEAKMEEVPKGPPMFYGSSLLTDNMELEREVRALCDKDGPGNDQKAFRERWAFLIPVVHEAFRDLGRMDLQAVEIHVIGGRVRAMASADFGRQDSGWLEVAQPSG